MDAERVHDGSHYGSCLLYQDNMDWFFRVFNSTRIYEARSLAWV